MSWVIITYVVSGFLESDKGLLNKFLALFGVSGIQWYNQPGYWPFILVIAYVWKMTGYGAVIYYAALIGIDPQYFEASTVDGATKFQQMRYISFPLIIPIIVVINLMAIGKIFYGDIGIFYSVTKDVPLLYPATDVIDTYVIRSLRTLGDIGMSSAAGFYQAVCGFILIIIVNWAVRRVNKESSLF